MNKGFTLIEALIVVTVISVVLGSIFGIAYQAQISFDSEKRFTEASQHARVAMDEITRYIRQAGNDPYPKEGTPFPAVDYISNNEIELKTDITGSYPAPGGATGDPDKLLNSPMERVGIRLNGNQVEIIDYNAPGSAWEVLAENVTVPAGATFFRCYDSAGAQTTVDDDIASVEVTLTASAPRRIGHRVNSVTYRSHVFVRSKTFDVFAVP